MKKREATAKIAAILERLPEGLNEMDFEQICLAATRVAARKRALAALIAFWPTYNQEEVEEGRPALSWRDYVTQVKKDGEWEGPIPPEPRVRLGDFW